MLCSSATYTWSKALGLTAPTGDGGLGPRDPFDWALDYGRLNFNYSQKLGDFFYLGPAFWRTLVLTFRPEGDRGLASQRD